MSEKPIEYKIIKPTYTFQVDEDLLSKIQPISPSVVDSVFSKMKEELERKLFQAMGIPASILEPLPEWVGRVIRIPEARIRQILGQPAR